MAFLSANYWICERALREVDGVFSVIRIVDYFVTRILPEIPIEQQMAQMCCAGVVRFTADDDANHTITMTLVRPNGEETVNPLITDQAVPVSKVPTLPRAVWTVIQLGVSPKQFGQHQIVIKLDGQEVARTEFTLAPFATDDPVLSFPKGSEPNQTSSLK